MKLRKPEKSQGQIHALHDESNYPLPSQQRTNRDHDSDLLSLPSDRKLHVTYE